MVTDADLEAMSWIRQNVPVDERFGIQTSYWLPRSRPGSDAGYWLPYFTGNPTSSAVMISNLGTAEFQLGIVEVADAVEQIENDPEAADKLPEQGVRYLYLGGLSKGNPEALQVDMLLQNDDVEIVYQNEGVAVVYINK